MLNGIFEEPYRRELQIQLNTELKNLVLRRIEELEQREQGGQEEPGEQGEQGEQQELERSGEGASGGGSFGEDGNSTQMSEVERANREVVREEKERKKTRKRSMKEKGIEGKVIPVDMLRRLTALFAKHKVSEDGSAEITAGFYKECDVDLEDVILSSATSHRSRVEECGKIRDKAMEDLRAKVVEENIKLTLHYDTKLMKQRMEGRRSQLERLALVMSAPELERPQLLAMLGLEGSTALEQATAAHAVLQETGLERYIVDLCYDTTAVNTGRLGGTVRLLQDMAGTTMSASPCRRYRVSLKTCHP